MNFKTLSNPKVYIPIAAWLISAILMIIGQESIVLFQTAFFTIIFSWYFFNNALIKDIQLPVDMAFFAFLGLQLLSRLYFLAFDGHLAGDEPFLGLLWIHYFLIVLQIAFLGIVLIYNSKKQKQRILFNYVFYAIFFSFLVNEESPVATFIYYLFLFMILIRRTGWINVLAKRTLTRYFLTFGVALFFINLWDPTGQEAWYKIESQFNAPFLYRFLSDIATVYLVVLLLKVPGAIIYNHISVSRKLWFAGIFQSLIPQIFQLALSSLIFFYIISGWQASNLRETLQNALNDEEAVNTYMVNDSTLFASFPLKGVIKLEDETFHIFKKDTARSDSTLYTRPINRIFVRETWSATNQIIGNGILAYAFMPLPWQSAMDKMDFWLKDDAMRLYPFSIFSTEEGAVKQYYRPVKEIQDRWRVKIDIPGSGLSFGKVIMPMYNENANIEKLYAFDLMFNKSHTTIKDPTVGLAVILLVVFIVSNIVFIRRVSGVGAKINQTIVSKFESLKKGIREMAAGNLDYKFALEGDDEFVEVGRYFNQMGEKLKETLATVREKDRLDQELAIARNVQLGLLLRELPTIEGFSIAAKLITAQEVSGDFYDINRFNENTIVFTIGDVSGKGTSAAFYMAQYISIFRFATQFTHFPKEIASHINTYFTQHIEDRSIFITAIIGMLDLAQGKIRFIRAGHNTPFQISNSGTIEEIKTKGLGIGLTKNELQFKTSLEVFEKVLEPNEKFVFYTDGVTEAKIEKNSENIEYGELRLKNFLQEKYNYEPHTIVTSLIKDIDSFFENQPKNDDITLFVIEKK